MRHQENFEDDRYVASFDYDNGFPDVSIYKNLSNFILQLCVVFVYQLYSSNLTYRYNKAVKQKLFGKIVMLIDSFS